MSNEPVDYKNELDETQRALREINLMRNKVRVNYPN
jgi:hypothetical protein